MTDFLTKEQRSYNMSRVKSKNTKPEKLIFKLLTARKTKYRKHYKIYGKPDIALPKHKIAIFIDGEFWHGKNFDEWKGKLSPFWLNKISGNIIRDNKYMRTLKKEGWHILRLWDKDIIKDPEKIFLKVIKFIEKHSGLP